MTDPQQDGAKNPIKAWFLGPQAENAKQFKELLEHILSLYDGWRTYYAPEDKALIKAGDEHDNQDVYDQLKNDVQELVNLLKFDFPFFSPRYIGHMLSEQSMPAMLGYFAAMLRNPNNVTPEAASVTVGLEIQVGEWVAEMLGFDPAKAWAHLCSGGTMANLEALWAASIVQMLPLCLKEICALPELKLDVKVTNPNDNETTLRGTPATTLIALRPSHTLDLSAKVIAEVAKKVSKEKFGQALLASQFNVRMRGLSAVSNALGGLKPIIFVSTAAHYSIIKVAQILGYGEDAIRLVPVTSRFRMDCKILESEIRDLPPDHYVAAVIGTIGTTEEGAVDSIEKIVEMRTKIESECNRSFWLHIDAAWGGYFASCFNKKKPGDSKATWRDDPLISRQVTNPYFKDLPEPPKNLVEWNDKDNLSAFRSIRRADSVTIDPHKTGYIPYPAGAVIFHDKRVKEFLKQRAQYISGEMTSRTTDEEENIGSYIIEGSKPGAAAAACWLAHKTIPLHADGHGLLMEECLVNAQKLHYYLDNHRLIFDGLEKRYEDAGSVRHPFTFVPITNPDTNVVTFLAVPASRRGNTLYPTVQSIGKDLEWVNKINNYIHDELSITVHKGKRHKIQDKEFFISHTEFKKTQYSAASLENLLDDINVSVADYNGPGIYLLRATVMNPFYRYWKDEDGDDLLFRFVEHLHKVARDAVNSFWKNDR